MHMMTPDQIKGLRSLVYLMFLMVTYVLNKARDVMLDGAAHATDTP